VRFGSPAWLAAVVAALGEQPGLEEALRGLAPTVGLVVDPGPGFPDPLLIFARHEGGRIAEVRALHDEDELLELGPAYVLRAPHAVWKALWCGEDPVRAALSGRIQVRGDLEALIRKAHHRPLAEAVRAAVPTEFE
jgi:hypothetical protein